MDTNEYEYQLLLIGSSQARTGRNNSMFSSHYNDFYGNGLIQALACPQVIM